MKKKQTKTTAKKHSKPVVKKPIKKATKKPVKKVTPKKVVKKPVVRKQVAKPVTKVKKVVKVKTTVKRTPKEAPLVVEKNETVGGLQKNVLYVLQNCAHSFNDGKTVTFVKKHKAADTFEVVGTTNEKERFLVGINNLRECSVRLLFRFIDESMLTPEEHNYKMRRAIAEQRLKAMKFYAEDGDLFPSYTSEPHISMERYYEETYLKKPEPKKAPVKLAVVKTARVR